jgi:hypothetical protein
MWSDCLLKEPVQASRVDKDVGRPRSLSGNPFRFGLFMMREYLSEAPATVPGASAFNYTIPFQLSSALAKVPKPQGRTV